MTDSPPGIPADAAHVTPNRRIALLLVALLTSGLALISDWALGKSSQGIPDPFEIPIAALDRREGRLYRRSSKVPFSGWTTDHFPGGLLQSRTAIANGVLHGVSIGYYTNGVVQVREHFKQGVADGLRTTWYANGQKTSEGQLVGGRQEGTFRRWYEDGTLAIEAEFRAGKPHGLSRAWHPSGFLKTEALMRDGEVEQRHYYDDGQRREGTLAAPPKAP